MQASSLLTGQRVLIIEDSFFGAEASRDMVERHGGQVIGPYATTHQAFSAVLTDRPTLALLDMDLDGKSSFLLADALDSLGVPITFLTGQSASEAPPRFRSARWIRKPTNDSAVLQSLTEILANTREHLDS